MQITSKLTRKFLLVEDAALDPDKIPEQVALYLPDGSILTPDNLGKGDKGVGLYAVSGGNIANITGVAGSVVGDQFVNADTVNRTILGVTAAPGDVIKATSATAGTLIGNLRGPAGTGGGGGTSTNKVSDAIAALSPKSWWKLDEASGALADSGSNGIAGTFGTGNRRVSHAVGGREYALEAANGQGGAVATFGDNYDFAGRLPFSMVIFHKPSQYGTQTRRVITKNETAGGPWLAIETTGVLKVTRGGATPTLVSSVAKVAIGEWNVYALTYDGTILSVYLNGELVSASDTANMVDTTNVLRLHGELGNTANFGADGRYSNFAVWDRALTQAELDSLRECITSGAIGPKGDPGVGSTWTVRETFDDSSKLAAYTDVLNKSALSVSGGKLTHTTDSSASGIIVVRTGVTMADVVQAIKITPADVSSGKLNVALIFRYLDPNNWLQVNINVNGAGVGPLQGYKNVAGTFTSIGSSGNASIAINQDYWLVLRAIGKTIRAEWWTADPRSGSTPSQFFTATLSDSDFATFASGGVGIRTYSAANTKYDEHLIRAVSGSDVF